MSLPRPFEPGGLCWHRFTSVATLLICFFFVAAPSHAQTQETGTLDRILHPDRTMKFDPADKSFGTTSALGSKKATIKSYSFGGRNSVFNGDGKFRAKNFANPKGDGFRTENYLTKTSQVSMRNSFAQADREFSTKTMDVRTAPAANKSAPVKEFSPGNKTFAMRGKRQDFLDDRTREAKNLSIDQVRDLLNKGPAEKPGTILEPLVPSVRQ